MCVWMACKKASKRGRLIPLSANPSIHPLVHVGRLPLSSLTQSLTLSVCLSTISLAPHTRTTRIEREYVKPPTETAPSHPANHPSSAKQSLTVKSIRER
mmetsp:Transcript_35353/g.87866  ORF Transcript_35353/g.87866 Transcript_35353/m.87866 type:complete len:99 (+) Transcript_35353:378-674(+)